MRWLVLGWVVLLVACAGGPSLPTTSTTTAPALSAVATTVPVRPTTPALARTPQAGVVSKPLHISSVDSAFFLAGIVTGTLQIDSKLIHVSIDEAKFIHRDTGAYTGSVELTSIRADLTEYVDARPVHVINETAPLPLHNTSRPGEHITVHNLRFSITRAGAERLDRYALGFRVDVRSLEPPDPADGGGFVVIMGSPGMFAGITLPPTITTEEVTSVRTALARTRKLATYRLALRYISHDGTSAGAAGAEDHAQTSVDYTASFHDADAAFTLRGQSLVLHGLDPVRGLEVVIVGDSTYVRGPLPLPGASTDAWYDMGTYASRALQPWYTAQTLIDSMTVQVDPTRLTPDNVESLDQQSCTIYRAGRLATLAALQAFSGSSDAKDEQAIERTYAHFIMRTAQLALWVCTDGYLHQMRIDMAVVPETHPDRTVGFTLTVRFTDIDRGVTIAPPKETRPFVVPTSTSAEPTPNIPKSVATVTASKSATVYAAPNLLSQEIDQVAAGETVELLERTATGVWYRVTTERKVTGWISVVQLPIDRDTAARVPAAP